MLHDFSVSNFKSLKDVELTNLPSLAVIVGPNASGKSNLLDAFDFLSTVFRTGLDSALASRGGYENVASRKTRRARAPIRFEVLVESPEVSRLPNRRRWEIEGTFWKYSLEFRARTASIDADVQIVSERLGVATERYGHYRIIFERDRTGALPVISDEIGWMFPVGGQSEDARLRFPPAEAIITRLGHPDVHWFTTQVSSFRTYQISPLMARRPSAPTAEGTIGRFGQNVASALRRLEREPERMEQLMSHVRVAVPSMEAVQTGYLATKELGLFFKEAGFKRRWFADDVSDGTIQTVALFLTLLGEDNGVLIEEPETSLHPWILRHFMKVAKEVTSPSDNLEQIQLLMTTHSPICVNEVDLANLLITERVDGETRVTPAAQEVDDEGRFREFLNHEVLGLGEIWDKGILGGVP